MNAAEITDKLGLHSLRHRNWYIQATCATSGDGLYEGLDWLSNQLKNKKWGQPGQAEGCGEETPELELQQRSSTGGQFPSLCWQGEMGEAIAEFILTLSTSLSTSSSPFCAKLSRHHYLTWDLVQRSCYDSEIFLWCLWCLPLYRVWIWEARLLFVYCYAILNTFFFCINWGHF